MIHYSVDTNPRRLVYYGLAAVSIAISGGVSQLLQRFPLAVEQGLVISGVLIYATAFWLFDSFVWKWPLVIRCVGIPDLNGNWVGTLVRRPGGPAEQPEVHEITVRIVQTWSRMDLSLAGATTSSNAHIIGLSLAHPGRRVLSYIYTARPNTVFAAGTKPGTGVAELLLITEGKAQSLNGIYFSDKLRHGDVKVSRVSRSTEVKA